MCSNVFYRVPLFCFTILLTLSSNASLEGWWRFFGPESDVEADLSGKNCNVFISTNSVVKELFGPGGGSLWFDGSSTLKPLSGEAGYAISPDFSKLSNFNSFTIAAWVNLSSIRSYSPIVISASDPDEWDDGFGLFVGEEGSAAAYCANGESEVSVAGGLINTGMWHHVAARYNNSTLSIWLDGRMVNSAPVSFSGVSSSPLIFGTIIGNGFEQPLVGGLADVRVWSSALSDSEIKSVYRQFVSDAVVSEKDDDADGMPNAWEVFYGLNPRDPADASIDSDRDGISNFIEFLQGRNPRVGVRYRRGILRSVTATTF